jgi:hypothetical protein
MDIRSEFRKLELEYCPLPLFVGEFVGEDTTTGDNVYYCYFHPVMDKADRDLAQYGMSEDDDYGHMNIFRVDPLGYNYWRIVNERSGGKYAHHVPSID